MTRKKKLLVALPLLLLLTVGSLYACWYSLNREGRIEQIAACNSKLTPPIQTTAPDGTPASLNSLNTCVTMVVPPPLWDVVRGRMTFGNVSQQMQVNPYSITDILLGTYTLGPTDVPCDQSATTTDCSTLPHPAPPEPQPYVPPNPEQPTTTWTSATGTPISLFGFSFELPAGWHGSVYSSAYLGTAHALVQRDSNESGFTIDCPPPGKGLEAATRLSSESRSFSADGTKYTAAFEQWTAPGNSPWYFLWIRTQQSSDSSNGSTGTHCLAQGSATPDIEEAMRTMFESWK